MQHLTFLLALPLFTLSWAQSIYSGDGKWAYQGCYNETTLANGTNGARALAGSSESTDTMTVSICLAYCASGSYSWAGVEYTKECYCAQYLSSISNKVSDSDCNLPCVGNGTEFCGGALKLSVYQVQTSKKGGAVDVNVRVGSVLALGIAVGGLLTLA